MTLHVVQHTSAEYLGLIEDHLEGRGIRFRYWRPFTGKAALPEAESIDRGLILLGGGPWGAKLPTLKAEVALAAACLARGKPVLGIGLGAQILALAAGAPVREAPLEFSVGTAKRTQEAALDGYAAGRVIVVPGALNSLQTTAVRFLPRGLVVRAARWTMQGLGRG